MFEKSQAIGKDELKRKLVWLMNENNSDRLLYAWILGPQMIGCSGDIREYGLVGGGM